MKKPKLRSNHIVARFITTFLAQLECFCFLLFAFCFWLSAESSLDFAWKLKRRSSSSYVSIGNSDPLPVISLAGDDLTEKAMSKKEPRVRPTYITSLFSLDKIRLQEEYNVQVRIPQNGSKKCSIVCRSYTLNGSPLSTPSSSGSEITNSFMKLCEEAKKQQQWFTDQLAS